MRQLGQPPLKLGQRNGNSTRDVAGREFRGRTYVKDRNVALSRSAEEILLFDRLQAIGAPEVVFDQPADLGEP
jgi:hypothetical protein